MSDVANRLIWYQGQILPVNDARIAVLSPSTQFGLNVFEGIPCYWNEQTEHLYAFRLDAHYARLARSARLLEIELPYSPAELEKAFRDVILANGYRENLSVRQTLLVGGNGSWTSEGPSEMFVAPIPRRATSAEYHKAGLRCCISSFCRISERDMNPRIKCGANYINSRMGQREALKKGFDTCIFLNDHGMLSEGPGSCLFLVKDGVLITPALTESVLESITRDTLLILAAEMGIPTEERPVAPEELRCADEVFLCGSAMELCPVLSVDGHTVADGAQGPLTRRLHLRYLAIATGETADHPELRTQII